MNRLQGVVSDLDHTLLRDDQSISPQDLAAIKALRGMGIPVVLATGRHHLMCGHIADLVGRDVPIISNNGATIFDFARNEVLRASIIPARLVEELWRACLAQGRMWHVFTPNRAIVSGDFTREDYPDRVIGNIVRKSPAMPLVRMSEGFAPTSVEAVKFLIPNLPASELADFLRLAPNAKDLAVSYSAKDFIDITMREATKGTAVAWLAPRLGFAPENALIMGDNGNDLSMLQLAAWPVAVENAIPEARRLAAFVTADNEHSPLSRALNELFPGLLPLS